MMTEREMTARRFSDAELAAIRPLRIAYDTERNPFWRVTGDDVGLANAKRWLLVHKWTGGEDAPHPSKMTAAEKLTEKLRLEKLGWRVQRNEITGAAAYFPSVPVFKADSPEQRALEDAFEEKSRAMHQEQRRIVSDPNHPRGYRLVKAEESREPPMYHEVVEAERRRKAEAKARKDEDDKTAEKEKKDSDKDGDGKPGLKRGD